MGPIISDLAREQLAHLRSIFEQKSGKKAISDETASKIQIKLHRSANPWKRFDLTKPTNLTKLTRRTVRTLNLLTPDNAKQMCKKPWWFKIKTESELKAIVELIFEGAINEPTYSDLYAGLCAKVLRSTGNSKLKAARHSKLLLETSAAFLDSSKCTEIEKQIYECPDEQAKERLIEELDEQKRLSRRKNLSNFKLIGALYNEDCLKDEEMDHCIDRLIEKDDERSFECLCTLLTSIGKQYERTNDRKKFDGQMAALEFIIRQNRFSPRTQCLVKNVLERRANDWGFPAADRINKPRTIDEVHRQTAMVSGQFDRYLNDNFQNKKKRLAILSEPFEQEQSTNAVEKEANRIKLITQIENDILESAFHLGLFGYLGYKKYPLIAKILFHFQATTGTLLNHLN